MPYVPVAELKDYVGKELGRSQWLTIDQERINLFAEATGDFQFIHVDPVKAAQTPFGSTIAHGFLSLSLMPKLMEDIIVLPEGVKMVVNYGLDSVRFIQPVKVNSKVRLKVDMVEVTEKKLGQWLLKATATLEIEGSDKPAYIAEPLSLCFV
ncbi:MaoC family dehydratase [Pseudomonas sp. TSRC2-2]|uniref:MaoC family dehydratase n=1 Tax=unclassified Pseudomonas TaxID=196821 RepID=UPI003CF0F611